MLSVSMFGYERVPMHQCSQICQRLNPSFKNLLELAVNLLDKKNNIRWSCLEMMFFLAVYER